MYVPSSSQSAFYTVHPELQDMREQLFKLHLTTCYQHIEKKFWIYIPSNTLGPHFSCFFFFFKCFRFSHLLNTISGLGTHSCRGLPSIVHSSCKHICLPCGLGPSLAWVFSVSVSALLVLLHPPQVSSRVLFLFAVGFIMKREHFFIKKFFTNLGIT